MNILFVIPALGNVYGGPSKSIMELAHSLSQHGITVDIVTTNANGGTPLNVPLKTWLAENSYRIQYFPYWDVGDYKLSLSLTSWLFQHATDYDLVHTNAIFSYPVLPAYWACQYHHVPYIITPHGMLEPWALAYKAGKKRFYFALLEKPALQRANALHMLASSEAQRMERLKLTTPLVIIPNGIHRHDFEPLADPELFYQQFPDTRGKTLIIFLGRIDPKKGLDLLAPAFAQARQQFPNAHLVIAGPDNTNFLPTAKQYFAQANCLAAVTFTGMLTGPLKYAALAAASIYTAPSYSEGFSMSVLEGMASGLPCIITTGCNFPEAAAAQVAHVVEIETGAIAQALNHCLSHPAEANAMGAAAREFIFANYTWNRIATQLTDIYSSILNQQPTSAVI